jgi:hypothetical protein
VISPVAQALLDLLEGRRTLPECVEIWRREERAHGLHIVDDHEPQVAPGAYAPRDGSRVGVPQLRALCRSWERFDRAFEPQDDEASARIVQERVWPFLAATGVYFLGDELAADHLIAFDTGEVLSLPPDAWDRALAHAASLLHHAGHSEWTPKGLRHALLMEPTHRALVESARRVIAACDH